MPIETAGLSKIDALDAIPALEPIVLAGKLQALTQNRMSGIAKAPVAGPWTITPTGLAGDNQADLEHHGGPEKALLHYARDHYAAWQEEIGAHPLLDAPGAFGENLSTRGWTEARVHIGDVVSLGEVVLQVSQGRQPCWKLNFHFGRPKMAFDVQMSGRTGWYYRVLQPGVVEPGDKMRIIERPCPDWPLTRLIRLLYKDVDDREGLAAMAEIGPLAESWRQIARQRLASRCTEDWARRLYGEGR
ncbi:MAG TPA: MOSC domain-containing protein [Methylovirgula sp.]|nr:MOSC domain-containing protein [Methylovirgula sp.]